MVRKLGRKMGGKKIREREKKYVSEVGFEPTPTFVD